MTHSLSAAFQTSYDKAAVKSEARSILLAPEGGELAAATYLVKTVFAGECDRQGKPVFDHFAAVAEGIENDEFLTPRKRRRINPISICTT